MYLLFIQEMEDEVSDHGACGDDIGVSASRLIFKEACVFTPVVSYFHPAPMSPDQRQPLLRGVGVDRNG